MKLLKLNQEPAGKKSKKTTAKTKIEAKKDFIAFLNSIHSPKRQKKE